MNQNDVTKRVITYVILVFVLSAPFYYLVRQNGGLEGSGQFYMFPLMWMPGVAGLITTFVYQRNIRSMGWGLGKPKYYLIVYGVVWLTGLGGAGCDGYHRRRHLLACSFCRAPAVFGICRRTARKLD
jgi:hypothetical protein